MNFYDDDIREFELYFATDAAEEGFLSYVRFVPSKDQVSPDFLNSKYTNGRFVVKYLNHESFLGILFRDNLSTAQMDRFAVYALTETQEWTLRAFIDGALIGEEPLSFHALAVDNTFSFSSTISAEFICIDGGSTVLALKQRFSHPYDLFLCECFEMLRTHQRLCKCAYCGKYFSPTSEHSRKYCSDRCRMKGNAPKTSVEKAYSKANNTKAKYASRHKDDLDIQRAYFQWQKRALNAKFYFENGEITEADYYAILEQDIKKERGI